MTDQTVTLEEALKLLSLPRVVGLHPDDNEPITTNFGRFGPYVKHGDEFRSLESDEDVFGISFDAALALIRAPKQSRRRQAAQKKTLRELTQDGTTLKLLAGRYGPYVTDGRTNASIPKTMNPEALTLRAGRGAARRASWRGAVAAPRARQAGGDRVGPRSPRVEARGSPQAPDRHGSWHDAIWALSSEDSPHHRRRSRRLRSRLAGGLARRSRRPARDAAGSSDRRSQDRSPGGARLLQLVSRRQAR